MNGSALARTGSYVESAYPVRYWLTFAFFMGVPGFTKFDASGLTHNYGLFNQQSLADIALTGIVVIALVCIWLLSGEPLVFRNVSFQAMTWIALLFVYLLASFLEPDFRVLPKPSTDLYLSLYRLFQWVVAFALIVGLYSREPVSGSFSMVVKFIARLCWVQIGIVWCLLPILPSMVYTVSGDVPSETITPRLGGAVIHPVRLGVFAAIACFHAIFFLRGTRRTLAVGASLLTLYLTYARSPEIIFCLLLSIYVAVFSKGGLRILGTLSILFLGIGSVLFQGIILEYLARGHDVSNITTLSERTYVWIAALSAFEKRPWIGYGFVAGVKNAMRDNWTFAHWVPPHAHNDLVQAAVSGGIVAAALTATLLVVPPFRALLLARKNKSYLFLFFVLMQLIGESFFSPLLSSIFDHIAALFICCSLLVSDHTRLLRFVPSPARPGALKNHNLFSN